MGNEFSQPTPQYAELDGLNMQFSQWKENFDAAPNQNPLPYYGE